MRLNLAQLLSSKYADPRIREFAVQKLDSLSVNEFQHYLPQLVQALKNESYHYSPLACLLLRKALFNLRCGHNIFWQLRVCRVTLDNAPQGELREPHIERYQLLLEAFLLGCGSHLRSELMKQDEATGLFTAMATAVQIAKPVDREVKFGLSLLLSSSVGVLERTEEAPVQWVGHFFAFGSHHQTHKARCGEM